MTTHSKTPWSAYNSIGGRILQNWRVQDADHKSLFFVTGDSPEQEMANAAHICLCVNAHEELRDALRNLLSWTDQRCTPLSEVISNARTVIDKLEQIEGLNQIPE